jgi:hypothetical protein
MLDPEENEGDDEDEENEGDDSDFNDDEFASI